MSHTKTTTKTPMQESDIGVVYRVHVIPDCLFNFYVMRTNRQYKDGTWKWDIGVELADNPKKHMTIDSVRGEKADAIAKLNSIIKRQK